MLESAHNSGGKAHWEAVYRTKHESEVSWHQDEPAVSLDLIREFARPHSRIIDIGGGSSILAGRLLALGFAVTVLDISETALERAKARIGPTSDKIRWIVRDITTAADIGRFDVWHDRAVFHFLTAASDRRKYIDLAKKTVPVGGRLIIGTFALSGPETCSGLPVQRYDAKALSQEFSGAFVLRRQTEETHLTPWAKPQQFTFAVLERVAAENVDPLLHPQPTGEPE
jgi:2-polyprenyl-3-methyl-5-hydroxy-6-metoxy-1,4-benzoquinol methylase